MAKYLGQLIDRDLNIDSDPDHLYVDFSIVNNDPSGKSVPVVFNDLRSTSILENPKDYQVGVCRFHIDTFGPGLPAWIPVIATGENNPDNDPNLTVYSVSLQFGDTVVQKFMNFVSNNPSEPTPNNPTIRQDLTSKYYFIYSYQSVYSMINTTLQEAFNELQTQATGFPSSSAPFILFDSISKQCIFTAETHYDITAPNPIKIFFNPQMYSLLSGFEFTHFGYSAPNGCNMQLKIYNYANTNTLELNNITYIQAYEQFASVNVISPIQSVIFCSSTLPLAETITNNSSTFGTAGGLNVNSSNATTPIITDFVVAIDINNNYFPSIDYSSNNIYRLIDMYGSGQIKNIQLSVFFRDIWNNIYPVELPCGGACNCKLIFKKKQTIF